jgi:hypothetical protein
VRAFDFLEFGGNSLPPVSAETGAREATNQGMQPRGARTVLFLFDDLSFKPGVGKLLTAAAQRALATLDAGDQVGIVTSSGLGPYLNPTRDRVPLNIALQKMIGRYDDTTAPFVIGMEEAIEIDRLTGSRPGPNDTLTVVAARECPLVGMDGPAVGACQAMIAASARMLLQDSANRAAQQMTAYQHAIEALKPAPAPKVIIVLSAGVATGTGVETATLPQQLDPIGRAAAEANVRLYSLSEVEDGTDLGENTVDRAKVRRDNASFLYRGAQTVATAAGGEAFSVVGTADRFFSQIVTETSALYRLGVEAPVMKDPKKFLSVNVTVKPPGLTVRASHRAIAGANAVDTMSTEDRLKSALQQGGAAYGVPIALATALRRNPVDTQVQVGVNVQMPASAPGPLVAMFAVVNEDGKIEQAGRKDVPPPPAAGDDYRLAFPIALPEGNYRLRFATSDAKGNVGAVEQRVVVHLEHRGSFALSDLITTWAEPGGTLQFLALETLPANATTLGAGLELYPIDSNAPMPDVTVRLALLRIGEETPVIERDLIPVKSGTMLSVSTELDAGRLTPGSYTLRATILEGDVAKGSVTTLVRKAKPL